MKQRRLALATLLAIPLAISNGVSAQGFPSKPLRLVVPYAPQLALLEKSSMLITHAGLNTALEGLARGLPMLCIPITNDQPGVAARIEWLKAGMTSLPGKVSAERIRVAVTRLMTEPGWRSNALDYQQKLRTSLPGVQMAADLIEHAMTTRKLLHSAHDLYLAA